MQVYGTRDVERLIGIRGSVLKALIKAGHVEPGRDKSGKYQFSFQDLVVLRTAHALSLADVPPRRIVKSLRQLRSELPANVPLAGLSVVAVGDRIAVREGLQHRDSESGQYLLALAIEMDASELRIFEMDETISANVADEHYESGCRSEEAEDLVAALAAYERCLAANGNHIDARINCGRLLHVAGRLEEAERIYREARESDGTLLFNLGVLLQDLGRAKEAAAAYREALEADPNLADAHYNLAALYEREGNERDCLRHLMAYRRATR